jgi:hypothetical protein
VIYLFKVYLLVIGVVLVTTFAVAVATAIARILLTTTRKAAEYLFLMRRSAHSSIPSLTEGDFRIDVTPT